MNPLAFHLPGQDAATLMATCLTASNFQPLKHNPSQFIPKPSLHCHSVSFALRLNPINRSSPPARSPAAVAAVSGSPGIGSSVVSEDITCLLDTVQVFDLNGDGIPISDLWKGRKAVVAFARHFGCVLCRRRADYLAARKLMWESLKQGTVKLSSTILRGLQRLSNLCKQSMWEAVKEGTMILLSITIGAVSRTTILLSLQHLSNGCKQDIMDAAGVALVLIGPGSVDQAKAFTEQTNFKGEVYADPSHSSYKAFQFISGVSTTFTPGAGLKIIQAYMEGYRQDWELSFEKDTRTRGGWQQGGIIVAGPGKSNISYIHKDKEAGDDPDIEDILNVCCS